MALLSGDGLMFLVRWLHVLAGMTWVGMLYYFNFVQTPFFASADPTVRTGMIAGGLVTRALWWFRWGAMLTIVTGWLYLLHMVFGRFGGLQPFFSSSYGWAIFIGGIVGTVMWFNVWFVIWPAQQVLIASVTQVARGGQAIPQAAARGQRAGFVSRTNTLLSIPMLFFMGAASHLQAFVPTTESAKMTMLIVFVVVLGLVEANALVGTTGPGKRLLGSLGGTLVGGFLLTAILVAALKVVF